MWPGVYRAAIGFVYLAMHQFGTQYVSDQYLLDPEFDNLGFIKRCFLLGLWGRCNLYKYISCWLMTEGVSFTKIKPCFNFSSQFNKQCILGLHRFWFNV